MTKSELIDKIRQETKKAQERYATFKQSGNIKGAVKTEINVLKDLGIINKQNRIVIKLNGKSEVQLNRQLRELEYFNQWKGMETKAVRDSTDYKKYLSFKQYTIPNTNTQPFKDYTFQEWRNLVELTGTEGSLIESFKFDSQVIDDLNNRMKAKNIQVSDIELLGLMEKIRKQGLSSDDAIDELNVLLGLKTRTTK